MEKRKKHNLLMALAILILLVGALIQVYLMFTQGERSGAKQASDPTTIIQQEQSSQ